MFKIRYKYPLIIIFIYWTSFSLMATHIIRPSIELDFTLKPLRNYSFHFRQEKLPQPKTHTPQDAGVIVQGFIHKGTLLQNLETDDIIQVPKELTVKAFIPKHNQNFIFILDKAGKQKFRTKTKNFIDLTKDLSIAPVPKHYTEYSVAIRSNEFDSSLQLSTSIRTFVGIIQSNFFKNFTETTSTLQSGFRLQQGIKFNLVELISLIDYSSYILSSTTDMTFASWKYGLGLRYQLKQFQQPTFIQLAVLGDLTYQGTSNLQSIDLAANSIEFSIDRLHQTKYLNFIYGLQLTKQQLTVAQSQNIHLSTERDSAYIIQAYLGVNLDYTL